MVRLVRPVFLVIVIVMVASAAWAQAPVTAADVASLEATANAIGQQAAGLRRTDPALSTKVETALVDLRDEVAFLKVKIRRGAPVTRAEFTDVRDRLEALRRTAQGSGARPAASPVASTSGLLDWNDKGFVNVSAGGQFGSQSISTAFSFSLYDEIGSVTTTRQIKGGTFIDLTAGLRVSGQWGVGFNFYQRSATSNATVTASVPDPILFDAPRTVNSSVPDMAHKETWIAVLFVYVIPVSDKIDLMILGGPAVTRLNHQLASSATVTEPASGPKIDIGLTAIHHNYWNYQVGADLRYMVTDRIGVGGFVRFGEQKANVSKSVKVTLGGTQVGVGLRVKF